MNQEIVSTGISLQRVSNLTSLTDSVANTTSYIYDNLDRVTDESNALGFSRLFQYDAVGNVTQITDRDGRIRQFSFDALDRLTSEVWVGGGNTLGYNYDSPGRLLSASDSFSDYIYTYDILDRMTSSDNTGTPNTPAVLMDFSYDLNGQRTLASVNVNGTDDYLNRYVWDKTGRITQILQLGQSGGNTVTNKRIDLAYNAAGQFTQVTRYEDLCKQRSENGALGGEWQIGIKA